LHYKPILTVRLIYLFVFVLAGTCVRAQSPPTDWLQLEQQRIDHQRTAMFVLGGWALGNIGLGLTLRSRQSGESRRFHEMNALWNAVNLGIAGFGYLSLLRQDIPPDAFASLRENTGFAKVLLFNTGLDVGYIVGGLYLRERARRPDADADQLRGYGNAILLQGGFLFVFDLVNYFIASGRADAYAPYLGSTGGGLGLIVPL
jgi:hypothetical protein